MGFIPGLGRMGEGGSLKFTNPTATLSLASQIAQLQNVGNQISQGIVPQQSGATPMWSGDYNRLAQQLSQGQAGQPYTRPMSMVNPWLMGRYG